MWARCVSTVFGLKCSILAMARISWPLPISSKTSNSRSLNRSTVLTLLSPGPCFATYAEAVAGVDQLLETFAKKRVIIDNDNPFRVNGFAFGSLRNGLTAFHFGSGR